MLPSNKEGSLVHYRTTESVLNPQQRVPSDVSIVAVDIPFWDLVGLAIRVSLAFLIASFVLSAVLALFYGAFLLTK